LGDWLVAVWAGPSGADAAGEEVAVRAAALVEVAGLALGAFVDVLAPILLDAIWQQLKIEALGWVPLQVNGCACGEGGASGSLGLGVLCGSDGGCGLGR
jgi:hypothetical protein